jgi:WD40 repeat protein
MRLAIVFASLPLRSAALVVGLLALACLFWPDSVSQPPDNPLGRLDASTIPAGRRPTDPPRELVAVLGKAGGPPAEQLCSVAVSADGRWIAAGTRRGAVRLFDVPALRPLREWREYDVAVTALDFAPDGLSLITGGADGVIRRWSLDGAELPGGPIPTHPGPVHAIAHAPGGRAVATAARGGVRVWDVGPGAWVAVGDAVIADWPVWALAFSPDGRRLACGGGGDNAVRLLRVDGGRPAVEAVLAGSDEFQVRGLGFAPDGAVASLNSDSRGTIWAANGAEACGFRLAGPPCLKGVFVRDGRHLLTVHGDGAVWVLRLRRPWAAD